MSATESSIQKDLAIRAAWLDLKKRCTHRRKIDHEKTDYYYPAWSSHTGPVEQSHTYKSWWSCEICDATGQYPNTNFAYPC